MLASAANQPGTGVEIHIKPGKSENDPQLERGFDDDKGMKYVKVFYNKDVSAG